MKCSASNIIHSPGPSSNFCLTTIYQERQQSIFWIFVHFKLFSITEWTFNFPQTNKGGVFFLFIFNLLYRSVWNKINEEEKNMSFYFIQNHIWTIGSLFCCWTQLNQMKMKKTMRTNQKSVCPSGRAFTLSICEQTLLKTRHKRWRRKTVVGKFKYPLFVL